MKEPARKDDSKLDFLFSPVLYFTGTRQSVRDLVHSTLQVFQEQNGKNIPFNSNKYFKEPEELRAPVQLLS